MINKYILNILYKRYRVYMVYIPEKKKIKNRKKFIYIYTYACTNEIRFQPKRKKSIYINKKVKLTEPILRDTVHTTEYGSKLY